MYLYNMYIYIYRERERLYIYTFGLPVGVGVGHRRLAALREVHLPAVAGRWAAGAAATT